jgi:hypothetical protein
MALKFIKAADNSLQAIGTAGIWLSEKTGGVILFPASVRKKDIKRAIGGATIIGAITVAGSSIPSGVSVATSVDKVSNVVPLKLKSLEKYEGNISQHPSGEDGQSFTENLFFPLSVPDVFVLAPKDDPKIQIQNEVKVEISDTLKAELKMEAGNFIKGIGEKELNHLAKIIKYEGSTSYRAAFKNLAPPSQWKFYNLIVDYHKRTGKITNVKSAWRPIGKQKALFRSMPKGMAASPCGSAHSLAALDIDRKGNTSKQVREMKKLGLLNKHGLWVPPEVREEWHVEDPAAIYFRFEKRGTPVRASYSSYVCAGKTGVAHHQERIKDGIYDIEDTFVRINKTIDAILDKKGITGKEVRKRIKDYMLLSVRSESFYGRHMVSRTGALGWWQFVDKTAKAYKLKYPMQLRESTRATIELAMDNIASLEKKGVEATVENIYFSHMIGFTGSNITRKAARGETLSKKEEEIFLKVVRPQLPKIVYNSLFIGNKVKPGISNKDIANAYFEFFEKRFESYRADNSYLQKLTGLS